MSMDISTERTAQSMTVALQSILPEMGGGQVEAVRRLFGGASQETWTLDVRHQGHVRGFILRLTGLIQTPRDGINAGAQAEFQLLRAAEMAGVPVPRLELFLRPEHQLGQGFVMQRLEGETLGRRIVADARFAKARETLAFQCGQALARIHLLGPEQLPALRSTSPRTELTEYGHWHDRHDTVRPVFVYALRWLEAHLPAFDGPQVAVHGDFRNGNLMVDAQGLVGVLDWELAHLGDPMEDLAWICVNAWRFGRSELPVGGFGTREALYAGYRSGGGVVDVQRVKFWEVMGCLKWGLVCDDMGQVWHESGGTEIEKAAIARRASEAEIDLLDLIAPRGTTDND